jgi:formate dehydrogenase assembly factor FdhD
MEGGDGASIALSVGAPSNLAAQVAKDFDITLVAFSAEIISMSITGSNISQGIRRKSAR